MDSLPLEMIQKIAQKMDAKTIVKFSVVSTTINNCTWRLARVATSHVCIRRALSEFARKRVQSHRKRGLLYALIETIFKYEDVWRKNHRFRHHLVKSILPILLNAIWIPISRREKYFRHFIDSKLVFVDRTDISYNIKLRMLMYPVSGDTFS